MTTAIQVRWGAEMQQQSPGVHRAPNDMPIHRFRSTILQHLGAPPLGIGLVRFDVVRPVRVVGRMRAQWRPFRVLGFVMRCRHGGCAAVAIADLAGLSAAQFLHAAGCSQDVPQVIIALAVRRLRLKRWPPVVASNRTWR